MEKKYGRNKAATHEGGDIAGNPSFGDWGGSPFADTRDTLCYATNENQEATLALLDQPADLAIVVGGYNSSNTSHIVELCEQKFSTYFISSETEFISKKRIN